VVPHQSVQFTFVEFVREVELAARGMIAVSTSKTAPPPPIFLGKKIAAVRDHAACSGVDLFINTRTDVYLRGIASGDAAIEEVIYRASRYRAAGCDGHRPTKSLGYRWSWTTGRKAETQAGKSCFEVCVV
jgi:Phosphoenolpyruvate phosphomutase